MTTELAKTFDPAEIEARWYAHWEANGCFRPERPDAEPFTIVNPPPNVTGALHLTLVDLTRLVLHRLTPLDLTSTARSTPGPSGPVALAA